MVTAYVIDTEATGNDVGEDQVIELAYSRVALPAVREDGCNFFAQYKPEIPTKLGAMATHHIIESDLVGQPQHTQAELDAPTGEDVYWIGHNVDFDWQMLGSPDVKRICTLALARFLLPHLDSHTQSSLIYFIGQRFNALERARERLQKAHNAAADVANCVTILTYLLNIAAKQGTDVATWEAVHALSEHARVPAVMTFGKHKGLHVSQVDEGYRSWYLNQPDANPYVLKAFEMYRFGDVIA